MPRVFICDKTLVLWSKVCSSLSGENVYACIFFQIRCISKTVVIFPYFLGASLPHTSSMPSIYKSFLPLLKNILCSSSLPETWNLNLDIHVNIHDSFLKPAEIFAWHLAQFQCTPTCTLQLHFQMPTVYFKRQCFRQITIFCCSFVCSFYILSQLKNVKKDMYIPRKEALFYEQQDFQSKQKIKKKCILSRTT